MMFINYRRRDSAGYATLLDRELTERFGEKEVFLSSRSIQPGADFVVELLRGLHSCSHMLVLIGPGWIDYGSVRRDAPTQAMDWVHWEIGEAFTGSARVIPILI